MPEVAQPHCELTQVGWSTLQSQNGQFSTASHVPSCFQIHLGGAKGVVIIDPTLVDRSIFLQPSQTKFDAWNHCMLDIQSASLCSHPLFLNCPIISILEYLGVKNESFIDLQGVAICNIQSSCTSFLETSKLLGQHTLGVSFCLLPLLRNLKTQLNLAPMGGSMAEDDYLDHHLINKSICCACAHIPVLDSFTLLGISNEWDCLEGREIYATMTILSGGKNLHWDNSCLSWQPN